MLVLPCLVFMCVSGIRAQVIRLAWQVLYPVSHSSVSENTSQPIFLAVSKEIQMLLIAEFAVLLLRGKSNLKDRKMKGLGSSSVVEHTSSM